MELSQLRETFALSPMQQGMLFQSLNAPQSGINVQQIVFRLAESLDLGAFRGAWQKIVDRHASFRTSFILGNEVEPLQRIHPQVEVDFQEHSCRGNESCANDEALAEYLKADRRRGFALERPSLMRIAVFPTFDCNYIVVWTFHHAILDGRCFAAVIQEVFAHYEAALRGESLWWPTPVPFQRYIEWVLNYDFAQAEQFWRNELKGFQAPTPLAIERSNPQQTVEGNEHSQKTIRLSAETSLALHCLAEKHQLTLNTFVEGTWALLLSRYSHENDILFGAARAGRNGNVAGADAIIGPLLNTLPIRVHIKPDLPVIDWLKELRSRQLALREHEHTPLSWVHKWSELPAGTELFQTLIVFDRTSLTTALRRSGEEWRAREFQVYGQTGFPITLYGFAEREILFTLEYDRSRIEEASAGRMLSHFTTLLENIAKDSSRLVSQVRMLTMSEWHQLVVDWNQTETEFPAGQCIHHAFADQVKRTPEAVAVICRDQRLTFRELDNRSNGLARRLVEMGVGPNVLVGISIRPSLEMMVGLLGILKAGGAYVPLDPDFPAERLAFMVKDSGIGILVTQQEFRPRFPVQNLRAVCLDTLGEGVGRTPETGVRAEDVAYMIYTSGSTGQPKGVPVSHRNVMNFFTGMDDRVGSGGGGTWLAVTSISFDISVLELFWTLSRGFKVVLQNKEALVSGSSDRSGSLNRPLDFSLFYFGNDDEANASAKYRLLIEGAKFADRNGFCAVWTPERHFHAFGGPFSSPALTSTAIAMVTERVKIRAGSVVLPLHHPAQVAEQWSIVDNLSNGRVGISFASGWHANDFVFMPGNYQQRKEITLDGIRTIRRLWSGEAVEFENGVGKTVPVQTLPRPVQSELPVWLTAAGAPETFRSAGQIGSNLLTHLLGQTVEELADKIAIYRKAWRDNGHPGEGHVTLMIHTFLGSDLDSVREKVRGPFCNYLKTSVDLIKRASSVWSFAAFSAKAADTNGEIDFTQVKEDDMDALLAHAFDRYFENSGLFGTPKTCMAMVNRLRGIGVNELACLIDFGVETDLVLSSLELLNDLRRQTNDESQRSYGLAEQIAEHKVTHLQCTPSFAQMLAQDPASLAALRSLRKLMLGGEALSPALAKRLAISGTLLNMYGPTETTVWSTTHSVQESDGPVPLGHPIANTQIYILDPTMQPVPIGIPGELFIGGEGVVSGYWKRPELTDQRFVANPFTLSGQLYRTGDLARYCADGNIEFLGRVDHQVKLRGFRIELGEIESVLSRCPGVQECAVTVHEDGEGDQRVIAYVIAGEVTDKLHENPKLQITWEANLRNILAEKLPDYMVPSRFVFLGALPRTPNGKLDRRALPAPAKASAVPTKKYAAPRTALEERVSKVFGDILGLKGLGVYDNFFELGGHSLLATQLVLRLRTVFRTSLPLRTIFDKPTVQGVASSLVLLESRPGQMEKIARLLQKMEGLAPEEIEFARRNKKPATCSNL